MALECIVCARKFTPIHYLRLIGFSIIELPGFIFLFFLIVLCYVAAIIFFFVVYLLLSLLTLVLGTIFLAIPVLDVIVPPVCFVCLIGYSLFMFFKIASGKNTREGMYFRFCKSVIPTPVGFLFGCGVAFGIYELFQYLYLFNGDKTKNMVLEVVLGVYGGITGTLTQALSTYLIFVIIEFFLKTIKITTYFGNLFRDVALRLSTFHNPICENSCHTKYIDKKREEEKTLLINTAPSSSSQTFQDRQIIISTLGQENEEDVQVVEEEKSRERRESFDRRKVLLENKKKLEDEKIRKQREILEAKRKEIAQSLEKFTSQLSQLRQNTGSEDPATYNAQDSTTQNPTGTTTTTTEDISEKNILQIYQIAYDLANTNRNEDVKKCIFCKRNKPQMVQYPCKHMCVCAGKMCIRKMQQNSLCGICYQTIEGATKIDELLDQAVGEDEEKL